MNGRTGIPGTRCEEIKEIIADRYKEPEERAKQFSKGGFSVFNKGSEG